MRNYSEDKIKSFFYISPILFVAVFVPWICYLKVFKLDGIFLHSWTGEQINYDFFTYYKSLFTLYASFVAIFLLIIRRFLDGMTIKRTLFNYLVIMYLFFITLSTLFSPYREVSLSGYIERSEGFYVLLSYGILLIATFNFVNSEEDIKLIGATLVFGAVSLGIMGFFQYLGFDLLQSHFAKLLMLPTEYHPLADYLNFKYGKNFIILTMYNPNYVGSYMAMMFPFSVTLYLAAKTRKTKIVAGLFTILMFYNWVGCRSRAGWIGGFIAVFMIAILFRKMLYKNRYYILGIFICYLVVLFGMNAVSAGSLFSKVNNLNPQYEENQLRKSVTLRDIIFNKNEVTVESSVGSIIIQLRNNNITFLDTNREVLIPYIDNNNIIHLEDKRYEEFTFLSRINRERVECRIGSISFELVIKDQNLYLLGHRGELVDSIEKPEKWGFENYETFASYRGYIWSRTIPMLRHTLFLGSGPDTYAIWFPQNDYIGELNNYGSINVLIDKPHNMYLQIGVNTGVVSLVILLAIFAAYLLSSFMLYYKYRKDDLHSLAGSAAFASVLGYLIAAMFNDSVVSVAPVFWIILGVGIACNWLIRDQLRQSRKHHIF